MTQGYQNSVQQQSQLLVRNKAGFDCVFFSYSAKSNSFRFFFFHSGQVTFLRTYIWWNTLHCENG